MKIKQIKNKKGMTTIWLLSKMSSKRRTNSQYLKKALRHLFLFRPTKNHLTAYIMESQVRITVRVEADLNEEAQRKCKAYFGIGLSTLLKLFLKAFAKEKNIGFYLGSDDFNEDFRKLIVQKRIKRMMTKRRKAIRAAKW